MNGDIDGVHLESMLKDRILLSSTQTVNKSLDFDNIIVEGKLLSYALFFWVLQKIFWFYNGNMLRVTFYTISSYEFELLAEFVELQSDISFIAMQNIILTWLNKRVWYGKSFLVMEYLDPSRPGEALMLLVSNIFNFITM